MTQCAYFDFVWRECKEHFDQAPAVLAAMPAAACEPAPLAHVLSRKLPSDMPPYRLGKQFAQLQDEISRAKLACWVLGAADGLGEVVFEIKSFTLKALSMSLCRERPSVHGKATVN